MVGVLGLIGLAALLAVVLLGRMASAARVLVAPQEVMYGEAIVYDQAAHVAHRLPLYHGIGDPSYSATAYGPIYYWLAGGLQALVGPGLLSGRVLSLLAGLTAATLVGWLARERVASLSAGVLAGALFLVGSFSEEAPWYAFYKEDVLAIALALGAIAALSRGLDTRRIVIAALLASLAILTKQSCAAAAAAGFVFCLAHGWRRATLFASVVGGIVGGTAAVLELTTHAFLLNTIWMNLNPTSLLALRTNLAVLIEYQGVQIVAGAVVLGWLVRRHGPRGIPREPLVVYGLFALVPLVGLSKVGSNYNYWFELAAALSVATACVLWTTLRRIDTDRRQALTWALGLLVLVGIGGEIGLHARGSLTSNLRTLPALPALPAAASSASTELAPLLMRVRTEPGPVLADPMDVLPLAGREIYLEPYIFSILAQQGRWDARPVAERVCADDIHLVVLGYPLELAPQRGYHGYTFWPPAVLDALKAKLVLERQVAGRYVYVTDPRARCT